MKNKVNHQKKQIKKFYNMLLNNQEIKNPYKVNWILYCSILASSMMLLIASAIIINLINKTASMSDCLNDVCVVADVIKNLSLGFFTSTFVALLIDIANIRDKNRKTNTIYAAVYSDLQSCIMYFIFTWSRFCDVLKKDENENIESHTWIEWYKSFRLLVSDCTKSKDSDLISFLKDELKECADLSIDALKIIEFQRFNLQINCLYNNSIDQTIKDFTFGFEALRSVVTEEYDNLDVFLDMLDAIVSDFEKYIADWNDIKYLNRYYHKPFEFKPNIDEIKKQTI